MNCQRHKDNKLTPLFDERGNYIGESCVKCVRDGIGHGISGCYTPHIIIDEAANLTYDKFMDAVKEVEKSYNASTQYPRKNQE